MVRVFRIGASGGSQEGSPSFGVREVSDSFVGIGVSTSWGCAELAVLELRLLAFMVSHKGVVLPSLRGVVEEKGSMAEFLPKDEDCEDFVGGSMDKDWIIESISGDIL